ncbi:MAG: DUF2723 domain-containing protein [Cyanobacteria bacterium]|nr:DUF2723 domain-containing protein [Cyanobacteriota bacterium]
MHFKPQFAKYLSKYKIIVPSLISFFIPLTLYILTLQPKLIGGETSWYALKIPQMQVISAPGYPIYSLLTKLITSFPIGDLAYKLNLSSAIFGALTIFLLFLLINILLNNEIISLSASLTFAFCYPLWSVANRLGYDTFGLLFVVLAIFSALNYNKSQTKRTLYFFFFCLGLNLTNHILNFFTIPALLLYIIFLNTGIFKGFKIKLLCIIFFILPIFSFLFFLFALKQGFGNVYTIKTFIYFIMSRKPDGSLYGGSIEYKQLEQAITIFKEYLSIIYNNYGIFLITISIIGFIYLIKKNTLFAIFSLLIIITNFYIVSQYLDGPVLDYSLNVFLIMTIYISYFFLLTVDLISYLLRKIPGLNRSPSKNNIIRFCILIILLLFLLQPILLAFNNYSKSDNSKLEDIYIFWNDVFNKIEKNSILYLYTNSANIAEYINQFERKDKNISIIINNDKQYTDENIKKNFEDKIPVYYMGNEQNIKQNFNSETIGNSIFWEKFNESLTLKKITSEKLKPEINYLLSKTPESIGEEFTLEYIIINNNNKDIQINSLELKLPKEIKLLQVNKNSYINQEPGISLGEYMWVSNSYIVKGILSSNLILELKINNPLNDLIKFRITTQGIYIDSKDIKIYIKD